VWDILILELLDWEVPSTIYAKEKKGTHEAWKLFAWSDQSGILEPWKGPGYTRQNTLYAVVPREEVLAQGRRLNHPTEMEGSVSPSQEEVILWSEGTEYEYTSDDPEELIYGGQPSFEASKPVYQSSFVIGDMATPYGGGERGVRRFSGVSGTIEVDDFRREFTMWCELQKSRNTNFNPYMVWRSLFGCLEGAPLADYGEFETEHLEEITTWRQFYAPDYVDVFGGGISGPSVTKKGKEKEKEKGDEATSGESAGPPPEFNPTTEFFRRLYRDY
jgi:hypothetical protein